MLLNPVFRYLLARCNALLQKDLLPDLKLCSAGNTDRGSIHRHNSAKLSLPKDFPQHTQQAIFRDWATLCPASGSKFQQFLAQLQLKV